MRHSWRPALLTAIALLILLLLATGGAADDRLARLSFLAVGQGDSILVQDGNGFDALIDGGRASAGPTVVAYLAAQQVDDLEVLLATHADADHIGGLLAVLESELPVEAFLYNGYPGDTNTWDSLLAALDKRSLAPTAVQFPSRLAWGELAVQVLNPPWESAGLEQNEASIVLLVSHGEVDWLLTGDIDATAEATIMAQGTPVAAEVLKVAHHGSAYSSSTGWLEASQPEVAVICVGPNGYDHPSSDTMQRLLDSGAHIWRTDERGTIVVSSDGVAYHVTYESVGLRLPAVWR